MWLLLRQPFCSSIGRHRGRASQADPHRKYTHERTQRCCCHRSALCSGRIAALMAAPSHDGSAVSWQLGNRILCDFRNCRNQLSRDCWRVAGFFVSHYSPAIGVMFAGSLSRQLTIGWIVGTYTARSTRKIAPNAKPATGMLDQIDRVIRSKARSMLISASG